MDNRNKKPDELMRVSGNFVELRSEYTVSPLEIHITSIEIFENAHSHVNFNRLYANDADFWEMVLKAAKRLEEYHVKDGYGEIFARISSNLKDLLEFHREEVQPPEKGMMQA